MASYLIPELVKAFGGEEKTRNLIKYRGFSDNVKISFPSETGVIKWTREDFEKRNGANKEALLSKEREVFEGKGKISRFLNYLKS